MNKAENQNQFVRSRCKAQIYNILEFPQLQRIIQTSCNNPEEQKNITRKAGQTTTKQSTKAFKKDQSINKTLKNTTQKKQKTETELDQFEVITSSPIYMALSKQYSDLKGKHQKVAKTAKKEIIALNQSIEKHQIQLSSLENLKNSLINEIAHLEQQYEDLRLHNYELRCQVYDQRGYGEDQFYDSQQEVYSQNLNYQEMLELQQTIGKVNLGYDEKILNALPQQLFCEHLGEKEVRCCICCQDFEEEDVVYETSCGHIHHRECIKNWLKLKRQCPLCRNQIVLP